MKLIHKLSFLLTILISSASFADWTIQEDNWYGVSIDGAKAGWPIDLESFRSLSGHAS